MIFVNVHNFGFMDPNEYLNLNFEYFAGILYLWVIQIILSKFLAYNLRCCCNNNFWNLKWKLTTHIKER